MNGRGEPLYNFFIVPLPRPSAGEVGGGGASIKLCEGLEKVRDGGGNR